MTKILLAKMNTVWGVIVRPQSSNSYRHVLSFDSELIKDQFINKYVFGDLNYDWKAKIEAQPKISFTWNTSSTATFRVHPDQYSGETYHSLLNKDFAIIKDQGRYFFMTLIGKRVGQTVEYEAEIDIFFTWDIKREMFAPNSQTNIKRAMADRFFNVPSNPTPITNHNYYQNFLKSPLRNSESFEAVISDNLLPYGDLEYLRQDFRDLISRDNTPDERLRASDILNATKWNIVYRMNTSDDDFFGLKTSQFLNLQVVGQNVKLYPYFNIAGYAGFDPEVARAFKLENIPLLIINNDNKPVEGIAAALQLSVRNPITPQFTQDPKILKMSANYLPFPPFTGKVNLPVNAQNSGFTYKKIPFTIGSDSFVEVVEMRNRNYSVGNGVRVINNDKNEVLINVEQKDFGGLAPMITPNIRPIPFSLYGFKANINNRVAGSHPYELKKYFSPFRKIILGSPTGKTFEFSPQDFSENEISLVGDFAYMAEQWVTTIKPLNYQNYMKNGQLENNLNVLFSDVTNYSLPTVQDAWEEFIIRNKEQQNAQLTGIYAKIGLGALGLVSAPFLDGSRALGFAVGGAGLAVQSALDLQKHFAIQKDIKNTPDQLMGGGSTLFNDLQFKAFHYHLQEYRLPPNDELLVAEHFYKYGYEWNSRLAQIQEVLNSRYYFNYVEIPETYENIILQASSEIKQIINDSLADGLTVWHVRDIATFKGVKNYEYENVEMVLIG